MKKGFYNIFFRGITLLSKFVFIVFLGKYSIDEVNLGVFGIISTSLALLIYLLGFDFYVFNTREIIVAKKDYFSKIRDQLFFHVFAYILIIPVALFFIFKMNFVPIEFLIVFSLLIFSEHIGQELYRLFTTFERSVVANIMLLIRSGIWVWYVLIDFFLFKNEVDLQKYILIWALFSWGSLILFIFLLINHIGTENIKLRKPDFEWITKGAKAASVFFIGSVSFQIIQFSDRYMIDYFFGKKLVGVYTAYAQFTNAIEVFTFSAITMVMYPKLISKFSNRYEYKRLKSLFSKQLVGASLILILIVLIVAPIVFQFLGKDSIISELHTFYILLIGIFFLIISNVFHYDLYVKRKDFQILKVAVIAMLVNVSLNLILIPRLNIFGAALATLASFLIIFILKFYYSKKLIKINDNS
ncbi:polysaccharide biosynthesis C-terminal domain-containing protein [Spongiivirga sp. MCCC 1A20706]|uniref:polysaccharide biosynthesis C-terminal domain-containing protein n=1 Tax=Spongiivirga sp. MCCC 1A20706 TaxID=3160963 RepID=UPI003977C93D